MNEKAALFFCILGSISVVTRAQQLQILIKQTDSTSCDVGWLDPPDEINPQNTSCSMLSGFQSVPVVSVSLFIQDDSGVSPCCGRESAQFRARLFKGDVEIPLTGRKSLNSAIGDFATVSFRFTLSIIIRSRYIFAQIIDIRD